MIKLFPSNEFVGAMISHSASDSDIEKMKTEAKSFLLSDMNIELSSDVEFHFVDNDSRTIHLALPYYSEVAKISAHAICNESMAEISGGEVVAVISFSVMAGLGTIGGVLFGIKGATASMLAGAAVIAGGTAAAVALTGSVVTLGVEGQKLADYNKKHGTTGFPK